MSSEPQSTTATKKSYLGRAGDFFFFHRNWMSGLMMIMLLVFCTPGFPGGNHRADLWLDILAFAVIFAGQGLRALVIGLAYIRRGGRHGKVWASELVTEGIFAHCRNPLYVGNILVYLGLFLLLDNRWAYAIGIPFVLLMYRTIVAAEEEFLHDKFGAEYDDYCHKTPRWGFKTEGLADTIRGMTFRWRRVVIKEYGSTMTWILVSMIVLAREARVGQHLGIQYWQTQVIIGILLVSVGAWATTRQLKLSGKLQSD